MSYNPIVASRILLEVIMFQGPYKSVERFRRTYEHKTLASNKSPHCLSMGQHAYLRLFSHGPQSRPDDQHERAGIAVPVLCDGQRDGPRRRGRQAPGLLPV